MTSAPAPDTEELIEQAGQGDATALPALAGPPPRPLAEDGGRAGLIAGSPRVWTRPTSCRKPWPKRSSTLPSTFAPVRCHSRPGCASLPGSDW